MKPYLAQMRAGERPRTTPTNPHTQLTQNAPRALQERVFDFARALADVVVGPSHVSVPGTRAFHLNGRVNNDRTAVLMEREFAHLHPASDGSLHLMVAPGEVEQVIANGWAERHPLAGRYGLPNNIVMVYGPRDEGELAVVCALVGAAHARARA